MYHQKSSFRIILVQASFILIFFQGLSTAFNSSNISAFPRMLQPKQLKMSAVSKLSRSVGKITPSSTIFFLCDIQDRFRPLIHNSETVIATAQYLTSCASELDIPLIATQQYTKVFGPTTADCFANGQEGVDNLMSKGRIFEKKKFSMLTDDLVECMMTDYMKDRKSCVLFGIEAHVCVQQTCLDLLEMGKEVHVVCDGVSSQQPYDREIALQRMANAGAFVTTSQSIAFSLMQSADHPNFKAVSKLTVNHMKLPNEFNQHFGK